LVRTQEHPRIPSILYGTAWKKNDTERLVRLAIRSGFRGIDTACQPKHYDEGGVGAGVAACVSAGLPRDELYLQTKFTSVSGQDPRRCPYDAEAPLSEQVAQSFKVSLQNLRTDYLDCLVLHSPMPTMAQTLLVWREFESLVATGGVRQLGISNCYRPADLLELYDSARIKPAVVQNRFYAETGYDRDIRAFCRQSRIIYQCFWTLTANPRLLAHATITALARTYERTAAQILFRYLTQIEVAPLTGTRSESHMIEDLAIFDFELTESQQRAVERLLADK
jgi:diketogulonate reductase-like aldo/keto reductase